MEYIIAQKHTEKCYIKVMCKLRKVYAISNNFRRVPEEEINRILGVKSNRIDAIYARVSSSDQKNDLYNK